MFHADGCHEFRERWSCSRRELLSVGAAAGFGLSVADCLRGRELAKPAVQSLILIYLHGAHPQHETWDPKPLAPAEVRGEFGQIATSLPGVFVSVPADTLLHDNQERPYPLVIGKPILGIL